MTRRDAGLVTVLVTAALALGACSSPSPDRRYDPEAAEQLQSLVLSATSAAHEGDFSRAAAHLDELETAATAALARHEITEARFEAIMIAMALVRSDLELELAAAERPTATEQPTEQSGSASGGSSGTTSEPADELDSSMTDDSSTTRGNGRGTPADPGPPDDRGKRD